MAKVLIGNFKGPKGDKGDKGDPGTAASIQVGTVQTVQPGENAEVNNTGTTSAAVLNFKIPRGKDGMTDLTAEYTDDSSYTCHPTVNAPVVVKELDGKTEQVETTGAQLFDMENYDFKTSRCTISKSSDYIIFTATAADAYFGDAIGQGMVIDQEALPVSPNTEYTVTISNNYFTKNYISFLDSNKTGIQDYLNFTSQSQSFTTPDNCAYILLRFGNEFSVNGDTERLQIMFNKGSTALPWEPYTGGSPAPSPDYPQVIKGVGGMGYFDGEWVQGNISSTGTIGTETTGITSANVIPCKQNDNIAVTYEDSIDVIAVAFYNASGAYISTSTSGNSVDTFTATAPANAASFKVNLRVVSGSTITPNGAKYCTVTINGKHQTGAEVTGKNLIDFNKYYGNYGINGEYNGQANVFATTKIPVPKESIGREVTFSAYIKASNGITNARVCAYVNGLLTNGNYTNNTSEYEISKSTFTATEGDYIAFNYSTGGTQILYIKNVQFEIGETNTDYTPYHHTALTIPLTSPLYEGDKICYVKPGESYVDADGTTVIADRILYGVYRENAVAVFDGSEDEGWVYSESSMQIYTTNTQYNIKNESLPAGIVKSDNFISGSVSDRNSGKKEIVYQGSGTVGFLGISSTIFTSLETAKTWLSTHPTTVLYKLTQPYFEPFTDQSIFYTLRTDDTLSYVYSNDPIEPVLTVEVAKNSTGGYLLESYAQAQKNAIAEANSQSRLSAIEQQLVNQATAPTE